VKLNGAQLIDDAAGLPGGGHVAALPGEPMLVGGAVRDLALGRTPRELDVTLDVPAIDAAMALAGSLERAGEGACEVREHARFSTARVDWPGGRVDLARRRCESYNRPGALPDVMPAGVEPDLARRDFSVNAIAVALSGPERGEIYAVPHALADLAAGRLRVLHRASFADDPTRLLRLVRYSARLGFEPEPETAGFAQTALEDGALESVSRGRVGAELRLTLGEPDPLRALAVGEELGLWRSVAPGLRFDAERAAAALAELPADGRVEILLAACLFSCGQDEARALLNEFEFAAAQREAILAALRGDELLGELSRAERQSDVAAVLGAATPEAAALAAADGDPCAVRAVGLWRDRLRAVTLTIGPADLLEAGVPEGPQIGSRLARTLARVIDGDVQPGRESELAAALETP